MESSRQGPPGGRDLAEAVPQVICKQWTQKLLDPAALRPFTPCSDRCLALQSTMTDRDGQRQKIGETSFPPAPPLPPPHHLLPTTWLS